MYKSKLAKIPSCVLFAMIFLLNAGCSGKEEGSPYQYQIPADTGDGWQSTSLEDADLDAIKISAMMEDIHDGGFENFHSLLIVKDGKLVFEEYFGGHNQRNIDDVASVTKSITAILVGIAIDQGLIKGADQYLSELLPSYADVLTADPLKQKLQLRHILSMTSGLEWDEETFSYGDVRNDATAMEGSLDPTMFVLNRAITREPGTQFQYCGGNSMLLSAILEEATGVTVAEYARQNLFEPLGISKYRWAAYPDGHTNTDGGLSLRPRDMAKIGQLMLNKGQWNSFQVVSADWVAESTRVHTTATLIAKYGYQWWLENNTVLLESANSYFAAGFGCQLISIYPDQNTIIIVTSETSNHNENSLRYMFLRDTYILPAVNPAILSKTLLWSWYFLTVDGLIFLVLEIRKGKIRGAAWAATWLLIQAIFGLLGTVTYLLSYRNQRTVKAYGWKAMGIAVLFATGNITGILLLTAFQVVFLPGSSISLLAIPAAFLVNWLVFIAPLSRTKNIHYWKASWQALLTAFISTCFTLSGTFPVFILLTVKWFINGFSLTDPLFWITMTACGIAGAVVAYPFSFWVARRNYGFWPVVKSEDGKEEPGETDRRLPGIRNAWGALLLGLILEIAVFGFLIMFL